MLVSPNGDRRRQAAAVPALPCLGNGAFWNDPTTLKSRLRGAFTGSRVDLRSGFELSGPLHSSPYGRIYSLIVGATRARFAVKVCLNPDSSQPDGEFAARQFAELGRFHAAMSTTRAPESPSQLRWTRRAGVWFWNGSMGIGGASIPTQRGGPR